MDTLVVYTSRKVYTPAILPSKIQGYVAATMHAMVLVSIPRVHYRSTWKISILGDMQGRKGGGKR